MKTSTNNITNLAELQLQIKQLKQNIKESEADFLERWKQLPQEAVKATVGSIIPFLITNKIALGGWKMIKGFGRMFTSKKQDGETSNWKESLSATAKEIGVSSALKMLYGFFKK
jgi:membrane protein insertase Oxa1/YidC/SpoIIIJ